jgi:hypothetical protein
VSDRSAELRAVAGRVAAALPEHVAHWFGAVFDRKCVELVWWTPAYVEERIAGLAAGKFVDHLPLRTAAAIADGIPLRGHRHADWCAWLTHYPEGLAAAGVEDVADTWIEPLGSQTSLLRPVDDAQRLLQVVFALNETWEPGWKRLPARLGPSAVKPRRPAERIDAAIRALDPQAIRMLAAEALALAPETEKTRRGP